LFSSGGMSGRMASLQDPYQAGSGRFLIWKGSWELWKQSPWYGNGLGSYWLAYPPYRPAHDADYGNAGFYAHNDYLQILIESGWPALILLLFLLAAVLYLFAKIYRSGSAEGSVKIEAAGLFAALFSVFFHSVFDFNLYTMPTMILAGLAMGRLRSLCREPVLSLRFAFSPGRWLRPPVLRFCLLLVALLPGIYFLIVGIAYAYHQRGERLIKAARLNEAVNALRVAEALWPNYDLPIYLQANIYQLTIQGNPQMDSGTRGQVYDDAQRKLQQAEKRNPLRPQTLAVRGRLYAQNRDLAGSDWKEKASRSFRRALTVDPRCYDARIFYAEMLLEAGDRAKAADVLKEGLGYWYPGDYRILPYYRLALSVCRQTGDAAAAAEAERKIAAVLARYQKTTREPLKGPFE